MNASAATQTGTSDSMPEAAAPPSTSSPVTLKTSMITFLLYLSTNTPAYGIQRRLTQFVIRKITPNVAMSPLRVKYQGMASILMPWAMPETKLAANNVISARRFFN